MDIKKLAAQHIAKVKVMQLATAADGQPWVCTVHFTPDDNLNLYWLSRDDRRHSKEIAANKHVAVAMAVQSADGLPAIGVQIEGNAEAVTDKAELERAAQLIAGRHARDDAFVSSVVNGTDPHTLYKLTPRLIKIFDKQNFPDRPEQQWRP